MAFTVAIIGKLAKQNDVGTREENVVAERFFVMTCLNVGAGYLMLADAGPADGELPHPVNPRNIVLGELDGMDACGRQRFTLKPIAPNNINFSGQFLPANGWLCLWLASGVLEIEGNITICPSACCPEPVSRFSSFQITGRYFPWEGELFSPRGGFGVL